MSDSTKTDETRSSGPTVIASIYTDHQKWIHYTDGSVELVGSTKTITPGYKTGMKVKPNMPVKNYANDYTALHTVYWLQYKDFFSSPFPVEHKFLCRQYSRQRAEILDLKRQMEELRTEIRKPMPVLSEVGAIQAEGPPIALMLLATFLVVALGTIISIRVSDMFNRKGLEPRPTTPRPDVKPIAL